MSEVVRENELSSERKRETHIICIKTLMHSLKRDSVEREYLGLNQQHHRDERQQRIVQALQDP